MPLKITKRISDHSIFGLWDIVESLDEIEALGQSLLGKNDLEALESVSHEVKRREFLSSRILAKTILESIDKAYSGIEKKGRKPYLRDRSYHMSISHAYPYAGVLLNENHACGIDIEHSQERLWRISHRFLKSKELLDIKGDTDLLCQYWCAKEALYKKFGHLNLSFKDCMSLTRLTESELAGQVIGADINRLVSMHIEKLDDAWIVFTVD